MSTVRYIFQTKSISKGETLLLEGGQTDRLYIIKTGEVTLFKKMPFNSFTDKNGFKMLKVITLSKGDIFG